MGRDLLVEGGPHQTRVAVLEDGRLVEFAVERRRVRGLAGNVFKGRVRRVLPGMSAAFVDIGLARDGYLQLLPAPVDDPSASGGEEEGDVDLPRRRQELLVQIAREGMGDKGPRIRTEITLPGRFLVLTPLTGRVAVSRRIDDSGERERLRLAVQALRQDDAEAPGAIVRTAALGVAAEALSADFASLSETWREIAERAPGQPAPTLLHQEEELAVRIIRDRFREDVRRLLVDGEDLHRDIEAWLGRVQPGLLPRLSRRRDVFRASRIDEQIDAALRPRAPLPSGGHLVINQTEALVAIDVNSGRDQGGADFRETVLRTNLEAVPEVVRQIRLRNLTGILVIDLIDMDREEHRNRVFALLDAELSKDGARTRALPISDFGLVQVTRQRRGPSLERMLTRACPCCQGRGRVKSVVTVCLELQRTCLAGAARGWRRVAVRVHPEVLEGLRGPESEVLDGMQGAFETPMLLRPDPTLDRDRFVVRGTATP